MEYFIEYQKKDIMALPSLELLEYVNYMMHNGYSFNKLCEEKGLYKKTIRARMKQVGAFYDGDLKKYIINDLESSLKYDNDVIETKKEIQNVSPKTSSNTIKNPNVIPGVLSVQDTDVINSLKEAILGLTNELSSLKTSHPTNQLQEVKNTVKSDANKEFMVLNLNGEVKSRPMKLYPEVLDRLDAFCERFPQYSKQRIISTLLMEAMDQYDR